MAGGMLGLSFSAAATLTLVMVNGVFVAADFAIVRVRRTRLEELAGEGKEAAKRAILVVDGVTDYLAVTQIGIAAASLGVGWFGEDCRAGLDSVVGVIGMKDAWPLLRREKSSAVFERAARPPIKIPADLSQDDILRLLQEGHGQMAIVRDRADEKTLGIVTLEDVLESLVGDVREAPREGSPLC